MIKLSSGKTLVMVPGSHTGTYTTSLRLDYRDVEEKSIDATMFLPAGSSVGDISPNGFVYSMDPLVLRDGHF